MLNRLIKYLKKEKYTSLIQLDKYNLISPAFFNYLKTALDNQLWIVCATTSYKSVKKMLPDCTVINYNPVTMQTGYTLLFDIVLTYDISSYKDFAEKIMCLKNIGKSIILKLDYTNYVAIDSKEHFSKSYKTYILKAKYLKLPIEVQNILSRFKIFSDNSTLLFFGVFK